jgi:hypothetical protein
MAAVCTAVWEFVVFEKESLVSSIKLFAFELSGVYDDCFYILENIF